MACCILIGLVIGAALAIKHRLRGTNVSKGTSPLAWRLHAQD
jgi:hypothetical protein